MAKSTVYFLGTLALAIIANELMLHYTSRIEVGLGPPSNSKRFRYSTVFPSGSEGFRYCDEFVLSVE